MFSLLLAGLRDCLPTAIILFRESLEIAMILSVVLAATHGLKGRGLWIAAGFVLGLAGAGVVACFAGVISEYASGMGQELFNACILFTATLVIGWTAIWMRTHARELVMELRQVGAGVSDGRLPGFSLTLIIGLALLREGSEIVLFIYGMLLSHQSVLSIAEGSVIGVALGIGAGALLYCGLLRLSARYMLTVTGWLLVFLVSGLSAQGARNLSAAGYFPQWSNIMWDSSWLLDDDDIAGKALHSLVGYSAQPTAIELLFYVGTFITLMLLMAWTGRTCRPTTRPSAA